MPKIRRPACLSGSPDNYEKYERATRSGVKEQMQLVKVEEDINENEQGFVNVNLTKHEGMNLGLTISGGIDREIRPKISNLRDNGIASKSDLLQIGDYITSVNGIKVDKLKHGEIISLLKNIGENVNLQIKYRLPPTTISSPKIQQKNCDATIQRDNTSEGFGFVVRGGYHEQHIKQRPLVVTHVRTNSPADKEGSLKPGDRILAINQLPLTNFTLDDFNNKLKSSPFKEIILTTEYDVSVMDSVSNGTSALMVEIYKLPNENLGVVLTKSVRAGKVVVCIESIKPASIADRCGALHVGDQVLSINDVSLMSPRSNTNETPNLNDANSLLSETDKDQIKIEIVPAKRRNQLAILNSVDRYTPSITSSRMTMPLVRSKGTIGTIDKARYMRTNQKRKNHYKSAMSLALTDARVNMTSHSMTHTVSLQTTPLDENFGIEILNSVFTTQVVENYPIISNIAENSPADNCGVVQSGDRILSVNGYVTQELICDDVVQLLNDAYLQGHVELELEFDVSDSLVANSGIFQVKLPAKKGVDIGIELKSGGNSNSPIVISRIISGSAAHRCGMLSIGDQILSVDGFRWLASGMGMNVDSAKTLLHNSDDVIKLKVQKNDDENEDDLTSVTYTVELKRQGGPLGITISGTEDPCDPILISQITPNSLAARTGALHVNDQILSINMTSLKMMTLTESINLLETEDDSITFKIKRSCQHETTKENERQKTIEKYKKKESISLSQNNEHSNNSLNTDFTMYENDLTTTVDTELSDPEDELPTPPASDKKNYLRSQSKEEENKQQVMKLLENLKIDSPIKNQKLKSLAQRSTRSTGRTSRRRNKKTSSSKSATTHRVFDHSPASSMNTWNGPINRSSSIETRIERLHSFQNNRKTRQSSLETPSRRNQLPVADWQKALDDLQSVGESSQYLTDLESDFGPVTTSNRLLLNNSLQSKPVTTSSKSDQSTMSKNNLKFHKITIKGTIGKDFGFSLSDRNRGIYVHTVKQDSPACNAGLLPNDRILQVNGQSVADTNSKILIYMISTKQNLTLFVSRYQQNNQPYGTAFL